ncbi:hypothetical protein [Geothrix sp. 21YS21S-4]|uniref:hypothetical protein n=1 Tax=Geothrix sp. 21YS21S-4 TaxID=3068889 RepID=UPI0027BA7EC9|nr:hypothetical protein [Geothrix sp. 21YS21S-4]
MAQQVSLGWGRLHEVGHRDFTYAWRMDYSQFIFPRVALSFGWLNEGHLPDHHRDGWVSQAWFVHRAPDHGLRLAAGLGVYRYFDTSMVGEEYRNDHGTRPLLSLSASHPIGDGPLAARIQFNRTLGGRDPVTSSILVGLNLRLGAPDPPAPSIGGKGDGKNELVFFYGTTILNSDSSETAEAFQVLYRRRLSPHWAWGATYVNEGSPELLRRDGLNLQAWLDGHYFQRRLHLAVGFGPYLTRVEQLDPDGERDDFRLSGRVSLEAGWRLAPRWTAHLSWNRTVTTYHRDTDLLAAGLGFEW